MPKEKVPIWFQVQTPLGGTSRGLHRSNPLTSHTKTLLKGTRKTEFQAEEKFVKFRIQTGRRERALEKGLEGSLSRGLERLE